jgi:hypothetical protein
MEHSKGTWKVGNNHGVVVTDCGDGFQESTGHTAVDYYGGYLIAESVAKKEDSLLIAAAPDLLEACKTVVSGYEGDGMEQMGHRDEVFYRYCKEAIAKATGGQ